MPRTIVVAALAVGLAARCADPGSPGQVDPLGTFCYTVGSDGEETCLDEETVVATETATSGRLWFQAQGTIELTRTNRATGLEETVDEPVTVFGQVPIDWGFPREAENAVVSMPVPGDCTETVVISPFGACDTLTRPAVCRAEAVYDPAAATVTVESLSEEELRLTFAATVAVHQFSDCCADAEDDCRVTEPASFAPAGPYAIEGRIRAAIPR
jgi:hypothetical protein